MNKQPTIGILTALPDVELPSVLRAFDVPESKSPDRREPGEWYWHTELMTTDGTNIKLIIACIGRSGNTESSVPTDRLIKYYDPEFMAFVGVACGYHKYSLGDVVTSEAIWAYEYLKTTEAGSLDRSRAKIAPQYIQYDISFFNRLDKWHELLKQCAEKIDPKLLPRKTVNEPALHRAIWIASGEKVMGNGELSRLNAKHDLIRAGEMEGYGFALACEARRPPVPWIVVRGISDYGDKSKDGIETSEGPQKDEYHHIAAQSAAAFLRIFLENGYTRKPVDLPVETINSSKVNDRDKSTLKALTFASEQIENEGIRAVYSSDYDPLFIRELLSRVRSARNSIVMAGMGLSFLKGNTELISAITSSLKKSRSLQVEIYYGDPNNKGIKNRVDEENRSSINSNRSYNRAWPKEHLDSIVKAFQNNLHPNDYARASIRLTNCLPMICVIQVDEAFFWYAYGTPNIRGKESPWILIDTPNEGGFIRGFLENNISYYRSTQTSSLLTQSTSSSIKS